MLNYLKQEVNTTRTEKGALTYVTTGSDCLDLFATIGALRRNNAMEIINRFVRAYNENAEWTMKLLFYARDVRGGLGERRVFRIVLKWLAENKPTSVVKNMEWIAEYGRYDDLLVLFDTPCEKEMLHLIYKQFNTDMDSLKKHETVSLLGKWLPSVNASNPRTVRLGKKIAKAFGLSEADYRKSLVRLRAQIRILENYLREKDYSFDYEKQPSRAMFKYRQAFIRNDAERYQEFLSRVSSKTAKLHADNVALYELIDPYLTTNLDWKRRNYMREISKEEELALNATWDSFPDFGNNENALAVIDTSGSMYWGKKPFPAAVALSLGLYFAEHSQGRFKNHFIEFSDEPQLIEIKGETFVDRLRYISGFTRIASTNLEAVFNLILKTAVKYHVSQEEIPAKLIIISDMEFNACVRNSGKTNFEKAKKMFNKHGYVLPEIIFWNVASRNRQQPVTMNEEGVALVSGVAPRIFDMIASGRLSPYSFMVEVLNSERYAPISA